VHLREPRAPIVTLSCHCKSLQYGFANTDRVCVQAAGTVLNRLWWFLWGFEAVSQGATAGLSMTTFSTAVGVNHAWNPDVHIDASFIGFRQCCLPHRRIHPVSGARRSFAPTCACLVSLSRSVRRRARRKTGSAPSPTCCTSSQEGRSVHQYRQCAPLFPNSFSVRPFCSALRLKEVTSRAPLLIFGTSAHQSCT
jgi:hypothetical protein